MGIVDWFKDKFSNDEEEMVEHMRHCDHCGYEFPEVSMIIHGESILCQECLDKKKKARADEEFRKRQASMIQKLKYYCYDCKFHFSRKKEFQIKLCPNCGSQNFVEQGQLFEEQGI